MSRARVSRILRDEITERAGGCCEYCGESERFSAVGFHIEHIVAIQHGGETVAENLALSCPACNFQKGTNLSSIDPVSGAVVSVFNPRVHVWSAHFQGDKGEITPLTEIGRATVRLLAFNRPERVAAREFERRIESS
jgi:hypothetical protein